MAYTVVISELHVPEMFFGESLLFYTDVDYSWLDSQDIVVISFFACAEMCLCVCGGGSQRTFPSHGLSLTNDLIKWLLV